MRVNVITTDEIVSLIKSEKAKGKKLLKMKVFQADVNKENGHLSNIYMVKDMLENGEVANSLQKLGYKVEWNRTNQSLTSKVKNGQMVYTNKPIRTTNITISWQTKNRV